jgi:hypothetical protein
MNGDSDTWIKLVNASRTKCNSGGYTGRRWRRHSFVTPFCYILGLDPICADISVGVVTNVWLNLPLIVITASGPGHDVEAGCHNGMAASPLTVILRSDLV